MRIQTLMEKEEKYVIDSVNKTSLWDKEFIIYQWYEDNLEDSIFESKLKIIFDICNISIKFVKVEKNRINHNSSRKKVYYLKLDEFNLEDLMNMPFVAKRRSIKNNLFLDYFLKSKNKCSYILEIENQNLEENTKYSEFKINKCVTDEASYLNKNLAIPFLKEDMIALKLLIESFKR